MCDFWNSSVWLISTSSGISHRLWKCFGFGLVVCDSPYTVIKGIEKPWASFFFEKKHETVGRDILSDSGMIFFRTFLEHAVSFAMAARVSVVIVDEYLGQKKVMH